MSKLARFVAAALALLVSLPSHAHAQGNIFQRATPDTEAALRARITGFFEAQQQGKWREAQKFVAEDSIDAFLERDKNRYASFEIRDIQWGDGYKSASVMMIVPFEMMMGGMGGAPGVGAVASAPRPMTHHWRIEDGEWFWYVPKVDPCAPIRSVVGTIIPECKDGKPLHPVDDAADAKKALQDLISANSVKPEDLQVRVTASASRVQMASDSAGEQSITVTNSFAGPVTLLVMGGAVTGLKVSFDGATTDARRITVDSKKTATLRLSYKPGEIDPPDRVGMQIQVEPLNVTLPVDVMFAAKTTSQK